MRKLKAASLARRHLASRRRRAELLAPGLFADPAWDMLLDLFAASVEQVSVSVTSACIASDCPVSTAMFWVRKLEASDLVVRRRDPDDGRRTFLDITPRAADAVEHWLIYVFAEEFGRLEEQSGVADGEEPR